MATTAIALGAAAGVVGNIGGALLSKPPKQRVGRQLASDFDAVSDPVVGATSFDSLLSLGFADPTSLDRSSPLASAIGQIRASGNLTNEEKQFAILGLQQAVLWGGRFPRALDVAQLEGVDNAGKSLIRFWGQRALAMLGIKAEDLSVSQRNFERTSQARLESAEETAGDVFQGRLDARSRLFELLGTFPGGDDASIQRLTGLERSRRVREINRQSLLGREGALQRAAVSGVNPGAELAEIERFQRDNTLDSELAAALDAVRLTEGRQALAGNELNALLSVLAAGSSAASQSASLRTNAGLTSSQVAAQQATAFNAARAQNQADRAQSLGAGVAAAGRGIGQGFTDAALLSRAGPAGDSGISRDKAMQLLSLMQR